MAMPNNTAPCFTCNQNKIPYLCVGCSRKFCILDLAKHRLILNEELNHIAKDYNEFKQKFNEEKLNSNDLALIDQINQWEVDSYEKVKQKAKNCREIVSESSRLKHDIEKKLNDSSEHIEQIQKENEFNETNLNYLTNELIKMKEEVNYLPKVSIEQDYHPFINEISVLSLQISKLKKWKQNAITVAGGNRKGQESNQFNRPTGICIDENKNIFIVDSGNHRVVEWKCNENEGQSIAGGNGEGNRMDQLRYPIDVIVDQKNNSIIIADFHNRRVIQWVNQNQQILIDNINCRGLGMDKHGFLYVSDYKKNEVRRWKTGEYNNEGIIVVGGNGRGNQLNQLNNPSFIFVDEDQSVYVSDCNNHRVVKWRQGAKEGKIVAGGSVNQLSLPEGIVVDDLGQIYVVDGLNHRIMRWCEGKEEGEIVVGGNEKGSRSNQLHGPSNLSFDVEGNLYVADTFNHRIQKFEIVL